MRLARDGFRILPVRPNAKNAAIKRWPSQATNEEAQIEQWFDQFPDMNYGIVGGHGSGLFILDADLDKDADPAEGWLLSAAETYRRVIREYGLQLEGTFAVQTPSGGLHHYFEWPEGVMDDDLPGHSSEHPNLGRGMDFAAAAGYVLGPGSTYEGATYQTLDLGAPLATLPERFIRDVRKGAARVETERSNVGRLGARTHSKPSESAGTASNPAYVEASIRSLKAEMESFPASEGSRDNNAWHAAKQLAKWVVTPDSGVSESHAHDLYMAGVAHLVSGDFLESELAAKWERALSCATPVNIPAPKGKVGRPAKPKNVSDDERDRFYKNGVLQQAEVATHLIEKWAVVAQEQNGVWYYDQSATMYRPLGAAGSNGPRADVGRLLINDNSFSRSRVETFLAVIQEMSIGAPTVDLDERSVNLIPLRNGVLDRKTRTLLPHSPESSSTFVWPVTYDPEARCPHIDKQVELTVAADSRDYFWEFVASMLLPSKVIKTQRGWFLYGPGNNGKSVVLNVVRNMLGEDAVSGISLRDLDTSNAFKLEALRGKRAQIDDDVSTVTLKDAAAMKKLLDANPVWGEEKGKQGSLFRFRGSMAFGTNNILPAPEYTQGWFRRWGYLHFPNDLKNLGLSFDESILHSEAELSGAFNNTLDALDRLERQGFTVPESSRRVQRLFEGRNKSGLIREWLDDPENGLIVAPEDASVHMGTARAWDSFREWVGRRGFNVRDLPNRNSEFHPFMERQFTTKRTPAEDRVYLGICPRRKLKVVDEHFIAVKHRDASKKAKKQASMNEQAASSSAASARKR
ncbi:bifunctional DNA primase/polymerase [Leifsonia xyli]|uniref:bifunctional DNA primase/polymerase n=1 Tax=Leifsonia xyli TaxID=1575 RepID=UPI003D66C621